MTPKERARLRGLANGIDTVLQIGKDGIGENLIRQADITLEARELIKGRVLDGCMDYTPRTAAETLAEATGSEVVQVIGSKFVLYRKKAEETPAKKATETPKKRSKPCQRKRAQTAQALESANRRASTPKHGGSRKASASERDGTRKFAAPKRDGQGGAPERDGTRKFAAPKRDGQGGASERDGSRKAAAPKRNGQGGASNRNGNHGGNGRPTRAAKYRKYK